MKSNLLATTTIIAIAAGAALAQSASDQIVNQLQSQGFTRIEVKQGPTQIKVEAIRGGTKVEYIYDARTGALLSTETEAVRAGEDTSPGVEIRREGDDFLDDDEDDDEEGGPDAEDDEEGDDEEDDDREDDDEEDDDEDDDEEDDDEEDDDEEDDEDDNDEEDDD